MSINARNQIKKFAAAILSIIIIAALQVIFLHLFANEEQYDLASNIETNLPITITFNLISGLIYWVLFELVFRKLNMALKAMLLAVICTGAYVIRIKYFCYINPGWPLKLIMITVCQASGNIAYPYLKQALSCLRRTHTVRA